MSVLNLLASMELISSSPVPPKATPEVTLEMQVEQESSPDSLSSIDNNQEEYSFVAGDTQSTIVCKCGYRQPFCSCGFYKFSG
ncbi:hypothetical protein [Fluoribacter gormanii]|uniref:Uncharacterized protein n=1 Tax=Fluoribacter gormanii TaxID=464 RepID=A0A377GKA2_9GAMM|nr:hypothetical protein [Fluoribacter gormanii]KTD00846.1 hypothetical protein Lgor_2763 [Fluoribacter gormanii]SIQ79853.1 hypothetical protein SAMN05421777_103103 [Fluoribacter gormanii]STO24993.1 Uncharacterised protein [Fluoribacter gormanii]